MSRRTSIRTITALGAAGALAVTGIASAGGAAAAPKPKKATISVFHAIPTGKGADVVDIYADRTLIVDNAKPGDLATLRVRAGTYDLGVYADGQGPGSGVAVLSAPNTVVPAGANATVTANLNASGSPALNVFVNNTAALPKGKGRLIVRHIAAAPAVDVRAAGDVLISDLANPNQAILQVPTGSYSVDVVLANSSVVAIGPATVKVTPNRVTIVYAWGSTADGSLQLKVQSVKAKTPPMS